MHNTIDYGGSSQITGEVLHNQKLIQPFIAIYDELLLVKFSVATYMRNNYGGLQVSINGLDGKIVKTQTYDIAKFIDNSYIDFICDVNLKVGEQYNLEILGLGTSQGSTVTLKCGEARNGKMGLNIFGNFFAGELDCKFIYEDKVTLAEVQAIKEEEEAKELEEKVEVPNGRVTVIIPVTAYDNDLKRKLDAISEQTYTNVDVIAILSHFDEWKLVKDFLARYPLETKTYVKQTIAPIDDLKKHVFARPTGEFVVFYDEDVILDNTYFEKMIKALGTENKLAYANFTNGDECSTIKQFDHNKLYENKIPIIVPMIKAPAVDFDLELGDMATWDTYLTLYEQGGDFVCVDEILLKMFGSFRYRESTEDELTVAKTMHPNNGRRKETSKIRRRVLKYIPPYGTIKGIDIGFGGDIIRDDFLGCDLKVPYGGDTGYHVDIPCDVTKGIPVDDEQFDVVYSSHLIEDFLNINAILKEFARILKKGGLMVLVFPDQVKYVKHCKKMGEEPNQPHQHPEFNERSVDKVIREIDCAKVGTRYHYEDGGYSHILKFKKR